MDDDGENLDCVCCVMGERRVSGWFVLSAVFIVAVFGLFFTFTERRTWPEQRTELSAADMRLVPPASTLWCEAVALHSDHPFVAYQVNMSPFVNPLHLSKQEVSLNVKLNGGVSGNSLRLKYYLLPGSVIETVSCAARPGARILVFQGEGEVGDYLHSLWHDFNDSSESDSSEDSDEDSGSSPEKNRYTAKNQRAQPLSNTAVAVTGEGDSSAFRCVIAPGLRTVHVNVTASGFYVIAVLNTDRKLPNDIGLRVTLDRARYTVQRSGQTFDMCSLSTSCTIGLSFASQDRALVWIPDEPNSGRSSFVIRSQCKPRLAVFAVLSVFFPLIVFLAVAFVVRADRERILRLYRGRADGASPEQTDSRFATPLLDDVVVDALHNAHNLPATPTEELPPAYHTLYDPPPPYACLKQDANK